MSESAYRGPLAGTATLTINGETWNIVGDAQWQATGFANETLKGQSATEGFGRMPQQGFFQATLRDRRDRATSNFQGASGLDITLEQANGKIITVVAGWQTGEITVNTQEGTFELHVESDIVTEDTVG
ncbi:phage tail tube protein [Asaia astilbis]|uniref:phage tail tube protein n=1 Tax=Asaia astilbis TaxID=610244 RepID=UPI00046FCEFA|nr:phage tail tube protein [Asaia astilbis]